MAEEPSPTTAADSAASRDGAAAGHDGGPGSRIEQFRADVARLELRDPVIVRERILLAAGAIAMALGVAWVVVSYFVGHSTRNPLQQRDMIVSSVFGLTVTVAGAAVFLRYSLGRFLRFWMARFSFEQQQQADVVARALRSRPRPLSARTYGSPEQGAR